MSNRLYGISAILSCHSLSPMGTIYDYPLPLPPPLSSLISLPRVNGDEEYKAGVYFLRFLEARLVHCIQNYLCL